MSTYNVNKVRKQAAKTKSGSHEHIVGVLTTDGIFHSNADVVASIGRGNSWQTDVVGEPKAKITKRGFCPHSDCYHAPYITTAPDHTTKNNLENLPRG